MAKRAVLYARVSGDDRKKEGRNLQGQLDMCRKYAEDRGWMVVNELAEDDRGASGAALDLPQLQRVFQMAENGELDLLVVRELDRLARGLAKQLYVENKLRAKGVEIEYVLGDYDSTPEGILMKNVRAVVAEYERLKITERSVRGRRQKVEAGYVMLHGRTPYGYQRAEEDGNSSLAILEEEARVVRLIYHWYTQGDGTNGPMSIYAIAKTLTEQRVPTRGDKSSEVHKGQSYGHWSTGTVSGILRNETYCGVWHYGKRNDDGSNPDSHLLTVEVPAIVDRETWEAVQRRRGKNTRMCKRNTKYQYLLGRRGVCGRCGTPMRATASKNKTMAATLYYYCPVHNHPLNYGKECDQRKYFRADVVEPAVWSWVKELIGNPSTMEEVLRERHKYRQEVNQPIQERLKLVEGALSDADTQMDRLVELYMTGEFSKDRISTRRAELEESIGNLKRERCELRRQLEEDGITEEQVETLKAVARKVAKGLDEADNDFEIRRGIIDLLDVTVTMNVEDGKKVVTAECRMGAGSVSIENGSSGT